MFSPFGLRTLQKVLGVSDDSLVLPDAAFIPLATKAQGQLSDRAQGTAEVHFRNFLWMVADSVTIFRFSIFSNELSSSSAHSCARAASVASRCGLDKAKKRPSSLTVLDCYACQIDS